MFNYWKWFILQAKLFFPVGELHVLSADQKNPNKDEFQIYCLCVSSTSVVAKEKYALGIYCLQDVMKKNKTHNQRKRQCVFTQWGLIPELRDVAHTHWLDVDVRLSVESITRVPQANSSDLAQRHRMSQHGLVRGCWCLTKVETHFLHTGHVNK